MTSGPELNRGFTLVELLVVVAILGILTSVVLVSLSTANSRGKDGAIQADLDSLRTQAQLYYNDNGDYGPDTLASVVHDTGNCTTDPNIASTVFGDVKVKAQVAHANLANGGGSVTCNVAIGGAAYAIYAQLPSISSPITYFCVDSNGVGMRTTNAPGNNTSCQ